MAFGLAITPGSGAAPTASDPLEVRLTAENYHWVARYSGADGVFGTDDDVVALADRLILPAKRPVRMMITSRDKAYSLHLPHLRRRELALPGARAELWLPPQPAGSWPYRGDQFCGFSHDSLHGLLVTLGPEAFAAWQAKHAGEQTVNLTNPWDTIVRENLILPEKTG
ncbi:MAG: hypothetical protein ACFE0O_01970 [Opitutales bacterium]